MTYDDTSTFWWSVSIPLWLFIVSNHIALMPTCNVFRKEWVNYDPKLPKMTYDDTFTFTFYDSLGGLCQIHFAFLLEP